MFIDGNDDNADDSVDNNEADVEVDGGFVVALVSVPLNERRAITRGRKPGDVVSATPEAEAGVVEGAVGGVPSGCLAIVLLRLSDTDDENSTTTGVEGSSGVRLGRV